MKIEKFRDKIIIDEKEYTIKKAKIYSIFLITSGILLLFLSLILLLIYKWAFLLLIYSIYLFVSGRNIIFLINNGKLKEKSEFYTKATNLYKKIKNLNYENKKQTEIKEIKHKDRPNTPEKIEEDFDESTQNFLLFYNIEKDNENTNQLLCYEYEKNICLIDYNINNLSGKGGNSLDFIAEPENEYDKKAIALFINDEQIGYVYRGHVQDMIHDWKSKKMFFRGYVNKINLKENKATYKIAFFKPLDMFESKVFPLIKTKKRIDEFYTRQENLECCYEGDELIVDYDFINDKETLIVSDSCYDEIGELGANAMKFYSENSDKKIVATIASINNDDEDNIKAKIRLYATTKK